MGAVRNIAGGGLGLIREGFESITGQNEAERAIERGSTAMERATAMGVAEQQAAREQITQQLAPFREAGTGALGGLTGVAGRPVDMSGLPSILPGDIGQDSLFQSLKRQAISGIESSAAARGKLMSGSTPQAIAEQVQNLALQRAGQIQGMNLAARGQLFGERVGEQERQYQQLFNLAGLGQASAAQQAANLQSAAANIGELYAQQANARAAALMGGANIQAQAGQGLLGMIGRIGGAAAGNPTMMSDRRVKEDIKQVGMLDSGLPVYTFKYKGADTVHMGVMAQDVEQVNPDAVIEIGGIKHVYYGAL